MADRKKIRIRVDWDNDGFLNQAVPITVPLNLVANAAYIEGIKARSYNTIVGAVRTDIKDLSEEGHTTLETDFSVYTEAQFGAVVGFVKPAGAGDNEFDNPAHVGGDVSAIVSDTTPPIQAPHYRITKYNTDDFTHSFSAETVPSNPAGWMATCFVRWRWSGGAFASSGGAGEQKVILKMNGGAEASARRKDGVGDGWLADGVWSDWVKVGVALQSQPPSDEADVEIEFQSISTTGDADTIEIEYTGILLTTIEVTTTQMDDVVIGSETDFTVTWNFDKYEAVFTGGGNTGSFVMRTPTTPTQEAAVVLAFRFETRGVTGTFTAATSLVDVAAEGTDIELFPNLSVVLHATNYVQYDEIDGSINDQNPTVGWQAGLKFDIDDAGIGDWNIKNMEYDKVEFPDTFWWGIAVLTNGDIPLTLLSGTAHNLSLFIKGDTSDTMTLEAYKRDNLTLALTSLVSTTQVLTTVFKRMSLNIPSEGSDFNLYFTLIPVSGTPDISIKGVQVTIGSILYEHHVGSLGAYDDITPQVKSAEWQLGRNSFDEPMAYEGTMELILDNSSQLFSPENTTGALFGRLTQNLKIALEIYHDGLWQALWTGWTDKFEIVAGTSKSLEASLSCSQGLYRLREGEFSLAVTSNARLDTAVFDIVSRSGWRSAKSPFSFVSNIQAILGVNTYLATSADLFTDFDVGLNRLDKLGMDWGRETNAENALKELLLSEFAKLMVDREGGLMLHNREHYINPQLISAGSIVLDTNVHDAEYVFGDNVINRIEVTVKPKKEVTGATIWQTEVPISLAAFRINTKNNKKGQRRKVRNPHAISTELVEMHFTFEEGRQRTLTAINNTMAAMTISVSRNNGRKGLTLLSESEWSGQVWIAVLDDGAGKYTLQLRNDLPYRVEVDVLVTGDYIEAGQGQPYIFEDLASQELLGAVHYKFVELNALDSFEQALALVELELVRNATPKGEINSMRVLARDDALMTQILDYTLSDIIQLSEVQSGMKDRYHIILGEKGSYQAGDEFSMTYILAYTDDTVYPLLGVGDLTPIANLAPVANILDAELTKVERSTLEKVTLLTADGETAIKFSAFAYGATFWVGATVPELVRNFSEKENTYIFVNTGSALAKAPVSQAIYSENWYENTAAAVYFTTVLGKSITERGVARFPAVIRVSSVWKAPDAIKVGISYWLDPAVEDATYTFTPDIAANAMIDAVGSTDGISVHQRYYDSPNNAALFLQIERNDDFAFIADMADIAVLNLEELDSSKLLPSTVYHIILRGQADLGETVKLEVLVVELDRGGNTLENIVPITLGAYGTVTATFTTSANCERVVVGFRYANVQFPPVAAYITGLGIIDEHLTGLDPLGLTIVLNGTFDTDTDWTAADGMTISGGTINWDGTQSTGVSSATFSNPATIGEVYEVTFTIVTYVAGNVRIKVGTGAGTATDTQNAVGTYTQRVICASDAKIRVTVNTSFDGSVDNVIVEHIPFPTLDILNAERDKSMRLYV